MFRHALIAGLIAVLLVATATVQPARADDSAGDALLRSARLWQIKGRPDLQRLALEKYLLAHPGDARASRELGELELRSGRYDELKRLIEQLRAADATSTVARDLDLARRIAGAERLRMATIQRLRQTGRYDEAVQQLRELFPDGAPGGALGIEYYRVIGSDDAGWVEAERGLRALATQNPDDPQYQLALAGHLTQRAATRAEGLRLVDSLREREDADPQQLRDTWRSAVLRLPQDASALPALRDYLRRYADDTDVADALAHAQARIEREQRLLRDPGYRHLRAGLAALDAGQTAQAERELRQARALRPQDGEIAGALGRLRLRQGRHDEAAALFHEAAQQDAADQRGKWNGLVRTARFWGALRAAREATDRGDLRAARRHIDAALALQPGDADARVALADNSRRRGDTAGAEKIYREVLARAPTDAGALRGLTHLYADSGRRREAMQMLQALRAAHPRQARQIEAVRAGLLRDEAQAALAAGHTGEGLRGLEAAQAADPDDVWIRFDLARLYQRLGLARQARELMAEGVARAPDAADAHYASALLLAGLDDEAAAARELAAIAPSARSEGMRALDLRLRIAALRRQSREQLAAGQREAALVTLEQAERVAGDDLDALDSVAAAWAELGQPMVGLELLQAWMRRHAPLDTPQRMTWAGALDRAAQEPALAGEIARLRTTPGLGADERAQLDRWEVSSALRTARAQAAQREFRAALDTLAQAQRAHADDLRISNARADVQRAAGELRAAIDTRRAVQQRAPQDFDNRVALARLLHEAGDETQARAQIAHLLDDSAAEDLSARLALLRLLTTLQPRDDARALATDLLEQYPQQPDVLVQAGRVEEADRHWEQALAYYREAQALERGDGAELQGLIEPLRLQLSGALGPERYGATRVPARNGLQLPLEPQLVSARAQQREAQDLRTQAALSAADRGVAAIEQRRNGYLAISDNRYDKSGTDGLSRYAADELALELRLAQGYDGHWFALLGHTGLDAGTLPASYDDAALFGQVQAYGPTALAAFPDGALQSASGTSVGIGYENDAWRIDLGSTPLGFLVEDVVGGVRYDGALGALDYRLDLSRRPVTSSFLSYAGARDPVSGEVWGGVRSSGLDARLAYYGPQFSWSGSVGAHRLSGRHVADNDFLSARVGGDWRVLDRESMRGYAGLALDWWHYDQNLGGYTFGHGGYYSPQSYVSLSLPLEWSGRWQRLSYLLRAAGSVSYSRLDAAPFYPGDAALQATAATMLLPSGYTAPVYEASRGRGTGYSLRGVLEYELVPRWSLGGHIDIDRSAYYAPNFMQLYLRYDFDTRLDTPRWPPQPPRSYSRF